MFVYEYNYKNTVPLFVELNGVAVFEDSPIRYNSALLYRIGLPSNTATPLALFVRLELLCFGPVFVDKLMSLRIRQLLYKLRFDGFSAKGGGGICCSSRNTGFCNLERSPR